MSTYSSVIPWKELAGMMSISMLSAMSLHTEKITLTQAVGFNYQLEKKMYIHRRRRKKESSTMKCDRVEGFVTGLVASRYRRNKSKTEQTELMT